jgi:hypothetical protein
LDGDDDDDDADLGAESFHSKAKQATLHFKG